MATKPKKPSHEAFVVTGEGENAFWTKISGVWLHDDGKGFNVELIALPVSGRLVVRERKKQADQHSGQVQLCAILRGEARWHREGKPFHCDGRVEAR